MRLLCSIKQRDMNEIIKSKILKAGVKSLQEFGYPSVDEKNIFTDMIYKEFFRRWLEDAKEERKDLAKEIDQLLSEII